MFSEDPGPPPLFQPLTSVQQYESEGGQILRLDPNPFGWPAFRDLSGFRMQPAIDFADWTFGTNAPQMTSPPARDQSEPESNSPVADSEALPIGLVPDRRGWSAVPLAIIGTWAVLEAYRRWVEPRNRRA